MSVIISVNKGKIDYGYSSNDKYTAYHNRGGKNAYIYEDAQRCKVSHYWLIGTHKQVNRAFTLISSCLAFSRKHLASVIEQTGVSILIMTERSYMLVTEHGVTMADPGSRNTWVFGDVFTGGANWTNDTLAEQGMLSLQLIDPFSVSKADSEE